MQPFTATRTPETLYVNRNFVAYVTAVGIAVVAMFFIELPWLDFLVTTGVSDLR
jgi:hypothetical protein